MRCLLLLLMAAPLPAALLETGIFQGRQAWLFDNGEIRVSILRGGGHIAEIRFSSGDAKRTINPMRVPHYRTIDPSTLNDERHRPIYGEGTQRWLSAGYMGHLLCFPFYGPPSSDDEVKAGLGNHGEAPIVDWRETGFVEGPQGVRLTLETELPRTRYRIRRVFHFPKGGRSFTVDESVENLQPYDRPFQWMQHATFGPPFVEPGKTLLEASVTRGLTAERPTGSSLATNTEVAWPNGKSHDGRPADLRLMQPLAHAGTYVALRTDPNRQQQFFTLHHPQYPVLIGYLMPSATTPWLADWQENQSNTFTPWNGKVIARGIEFGNSPFAEGLRKAVDRGSLFGAPAYEWIGARATRKTSFTVFLYEIPEGFRGVKDVVTTPSLQVIPR